MSTPINPIVTNTEPFFSKSQRVVCEYDFPERDIYLILAILRDVLATGQLMVNFSQGGIGSVRFREEQKLPLPENK